MSNISVNNKRIAKNTLMLYFRMIFVMVIKLFTSRVILQVIGIEDYGVYNLVAGIIVLFSFLNAAMNGASQRYFNIALGENNLLKFKTYFCNAVNAHFIISLFSVIICEVLGVYLLNNNLNIPENRLFATKVIFQIAIITSVFNIIRTPYNAVIIAFERMSFYAYISIVEVILNLGIVFLLKIINYDKLITYSVLVLAISVIIFIVYVIYCYKYYEVARYKLSFNKTIVKEIISFSSWSTLSSFANIGVKQGFNIILNLFYGVTLNAAIGIMNQVSSAIYSFIQNFQIAVNPQLIKSYASNDNAYLKKLFYSSSKVSYYLLYIISMPIILCMDEVLYIWLKNVPEYTASLCTLAIFALCVNSLGGPIWTVIQASGKIKRYQIFISVVTLLNLPLYYLILYIGLPPFYPLFLPIITNVAVVIYGLDVLIKEINISIKEYISKIIVPIIRSSIISLTTLLVVLYLLKKHIDNEYLFVFTMVIISILIICISIYYTGIDKIEKEFVRTKIYSIVRLKK